VADGYKMVGNAVPVKFADVLAQKIKIDLEDYGKIDREKVVKGAIVGPDFGGLSNRKLSLFS
jgi:hypothetical protein